MIREELVRFRVITDKRGMITTGTKVWNEKAQRDIPVQLDYFNVSKFPVIEQIYGKTPKEIIIFFPSDRFEDFFDDGFAGFGSNQVLKRRCDGVDCYHNIQETLNLVPIGVDPDDADAVFNSYEFGEREKGDCVCSRMKWEVPNPKKQGEMMKNPLRCGFGMFMAAWVYAPNAKIPLNGLPIKFHSGSKPNSDYFKSALRMYKKYQGVPFRLWCEQVNNKKGKIFTRWFIEPYLTNDHLLAYVQENMEAVKYEIPEAIKTEEQKSSAGFNSSGEPEFHAETTPPPPTAGRPKEREKKQKPKAVEAEHMVLLNFEEIKKKLEREGTMGNMESLKKAWTDMQESINALYQKQKDEVMKCKEDAKAKILGRADDLPF